MADPSFYDTAPKPDEATSASYTADQRQVDQPTGTVAGQLTGLLDDNSKYIQRARTKSAQTANSRGLLNSSIAAGAGEAAAIDAALPIAQQDATAYNKQNQLNQTSSNQAQQFNAGNKQQSEIFNKDFKNQGYFREQDVANKLKVDQNTFNNQTAMNTQQNTAAKELQGQQDTAAYNRSLLTTDTQKFLAQQDKTMQEKIAAGEITQKNSQYYTDYVSSASQQYQIQRTKIELDPGLSLEEKNTANARLDASFRGNMSVVATLYDVHISWDKNGAILGSTNTDLSTNTNLVNNADQAAADQAAADQAAADQAAADAAAAKSTSTAAPITYEPGGH